jgi:hypothetical protein
MKWQELAQASIGPQGGTVTGGKATVTIPAGSFAAQAQVALLQGSGATGFGQYQLGEVYALSGLPETIQAPITVSLDITGKTLPQGDAFVVVQPAEDDFGAIFCKATQEGNRLVATLTPRKSVSGTGAANSASGHVRAAVRAARPGSEGIAGVYRAVMTFVGGHRERMSPSGRFRILSPYLVATDLIAQGLDDAYVAVGSLGLRVAGGQDLPTDVYITTRATWEPWGEVWSDEPWPFAAQGYTALCVPLSLLSGPVDLIRPKLGHLLLHLTQDSYDPRPFYNRVPSTNRWLWLDEAVATWFELLLAEPQYVPSQALARRGFLFSHGLEYPVRTSGLLVTTDNTRSVRAHGYGASMFIGYLERHQDEFVSEAIIGYPWLITLYGLRAQSDGAAVTPTFRYSPVEALQVLTKNTLHTHWSLFCEDYVQGKIYEDESGGWLPLKDWTQELLEVAQPEFFAGPPEELTRTITWNAPDLSAHLYRVRFKDYWLGKKATLKLTLESTAGNRGGALLHKVNLDGIIGPLVKAMNNNTTFELEDAATTYGQNADSLLIMVVNTRAQAPFDETSRVTLTITLKAETPDTSWVNSLNAMRVMALPALKCVTSGPAGVCGALWSGHIETWPNKTAFRWTGSRDFAYTGPDYQAGTVSLNGRVSEQLDKLESLHFEHSWAQDPYTFSVVVTMRNLDGGPNPAPTTLDYTVTKSNLRNNLSFYLPEFRYTITNKDGTPGPAVEIDWDRSATYPIEVRLYKF